MKRVLLFLTALPIFTLLGGFADQLDRRGPMPLDLPVGKTPQEDEDEAEDIITFFGAEISGQQFFFLIAHKTSGNAYSNYDYVKQEIMNGIRQLSGRSRFTVVDHGGDTNDGNIHGPRVWSRRPVPATTSNKTRAVAWIESLEEPSVLQYHPFYCPLPSALTTVHIANKHQRRMKNTLIFVGDWYPLCYVAEAEVSETIEAITDANSRRFRIHTFFIRNNHGHGGAAQSSRDFWEGLAEANNGTFTLVPVE